MPLNSFSQLAGSFRLRSIPSLSIQRSFRLPSAAISKSREVVDCNQRPFPPEGERKEGGAVRAVAFRVPPSLGSLPHRGSVPL